MSSKINGGDQTCGNCAHSFIEGGTMFCALNPPSTFPIVVMGMAPNGQPMANVAAWVSNFPSVDPERKCGQHKRQLVTIEGAATAARFSVRR